MVEESGNCPVPPCSGSLYRYPSAAPPGLAKFSQTCPQLASINTALAFPRYPASTVPSQSARISVSIRTRKCLKVSASLSPLQQPLFASFSPLQLPLFASLSPLQLPLFASLSPLQQPLIAFPTPLQQPLIASPTPLQQPLIASPTPLQQPLFLQPANSERLRPTLHSFYASQFADWLTTTVQTLIQTCTRSKAGYAVMQHWRRRREYHTIFNDRLAVIATLSTSHLGKLREAQPPSTV